MQITNQYTEKIMIEAYEQLQKIKEEKPEEDLSKNFDFIEYTRIFHLAVLSLADKRLKNDGHTLFYLQRNVDNPEIEICTENKEIVTVSKEFLLENLGSEELIQQLLDTNMQMSDAIAHIEEVLPDKIEEATINDDVSQISDAKAHEIDSTLNYEAVTGTNDKIVSEKSAEFEDFDYAKQNEEDMSQKKTPVIMTGPVKEAEILLPPETNQKKEEQKENTKEPVAETVKEDTTHLAESMIQSSNEVEVPHQDIEDVENIESNSDSMKEKMVSEPEKPVQEEMKNTRIIEKNEETSQNNNDDVIIDKEMEKEIRTFFCDKHVIQLNGNEYLFHVYPLKYVKENQVISTEIFVTMMTPQNTYRAYSSLRGGTKQNVKIVINDVTLVVRGSWKNEKFSSSIASITPNVIVKDMVTEIRPAVKNSNTHLIFNRNDMEIHVFPIIFSNDTKKGLCPCAVCTRQNKNVEIFAPSGLLQTAYQKNSETMLEMYIEGIEPVLIVSEI